MDLLRIDGSGNGFVRTLHSNSCSREHRKGLGIRDPGCVRFVNIKFEEEHKDSLVGRDFPATSSLNRGKSREATQFSWAQRNLRETHAAS